MGKDGPSSTLVGSRQADPADTRSLLQVASDLNIGSAERTRIAPTPSGYLHQGNAINFLLTNAIAKASGAEVLLRIDDLDWERARSEYVEGIFKSLRWLGIEWDQGPNNVQELEATWSQEHRLDLYDEAIEKLRSGGHLYACGCSRTQLQRTADIEHSCRHAEHPFDAPEMAWRLRLTERADVRWVELSGVEISVDLSEEIPDPVIRQKNGRPAYQIASLVDDLHFGVDLVVRGDDLRASTACQICLAKLLEENAFRQVKFLHHPLVTDEAGEKLSKSAGGKADESLSTSDHDRIALIKQAVATLNSVWLST